jgi:hypothetical protein
LADTLPLRADAGRHLEAGGRRSGGEGAVAAASSPALASATLISLFE